jgi:Phospholipid-translocating ATPase N-terminal
MPQAGVKDKQFCSNKVRTAKYNVVTFLPIFLAEQFSQVAYFYFLVQVRSCV